MPTWLLVGGLVVASTLGRFLLALRDPGPWIFHDELAYEELAKSFGTAGHFAIRGVAGTGGFGILYPALISPAFAIFDGIPAAYDALRLINCLLVSLTAIPVYLIARRLAGRWLSLAAATLSLAIPTLMYTSNVMTENAFYPVTALFGLVLIRALDRPTLLRQAVVFVVIGLAFLTRVQAIVLVPVLGTALGLTVLLDVLASRGRLWDRIRQAVLPFWPTLGLIAIGAVAVPVRQVVRGQPLAGILGAYSGVTKLGYDWTAVGKYVLYHLADLDILVGFVPFAALIAFVIWTLRPSQPRELRIFGAAAVSLVVWFVVVAAAYGSTPVAMRIVERNMFHVVPFFFIALVGWIAHGCPRPWWVVVPAGLGAGAITLFLPLNSFLNATVIHSTPGLMPIWRWRDHLFSAGSIDEVVFAAAVAGAVVLAFLPRRFAVLVPVVLLLYFAAATRPVESFTRRASIESYRFGIGGPPRDWIDTAVGRDTAVASFWWIGLNAVPFWESHFFNRSMTRAYTLTGPYDGLPFTYVAVGPSGRIVDTSGRPVRERFVLTDRDTHVRGRVVASNPAAALAVYEIRGPLTVNERLDGRFNDDWSGPYFAYQRRNCSGGTLHLALENNPLVHPHPFAVPVHVQGAEVRRLRIRPQQRRYRISVPLRADRGLCQMDLEIPTAPARVVDAGDLRDVGLIVRDARYEPPR